MQAAMTGRPAFRVDDAEVGRTRFYELACDPRRSVVVEACAGAGKTWMLVSRILRALLGGAQPHEILAITYTRKAAGEMRERLSNLMAEFAHPETTDEQRAEGLIARGVPQEDARRLAPELASLYERVLRSGRTVEVRTFHAWFAQLLHAAPRELLDEIGLQPDMGLVEDVEDLKVDIFRRFHEAILKSSQLSEDLTAVVQARGRALTMKWLEAALDKRVELELADLHGTLENGVAAATAQFPQFLGLNTPADFFRQPEQVEAIAALANELALNKNQTPQKAAAALRDALSTSDATAMLATLKGAVLTKAGSLKAHLKASGLEEFSRQLEAVDRANLQHECHMEHLRMVRLSRALLKEYAAYKKARGLADMADLENCAQRLLREATLSGWVQEKLDARIRHILIDEFQDTSPLQWHALQAWLSGYAGSGGGRARPSVFIVGDPKQSIYRFRRAEPRVFTAAKEFVRTTLGGTVLECDHTRRNAPAILQALNDVFQRATERAEFGGFHPHTTEVGEGADLSGTGVFSLEPVSREIEKRERKPAKDGLWRDTLAVPRAEPEAELRRLECDRVAKAVSVLISRGMKASDIMILSRKRSTLLRTQESLQALHIAYAEVEANNLAEAAEVQDLLAVLDVLVSNRHDIALARALRSPMFGCSDSSLVWLAEHSEQKARSWFACLQEATSEDLATLSAADADALLHAKAVLKLLAREASTMPPHDLLDAVLARTGYRDRVAATVPPESRSSALKAVDALLAKALEFSGGRYSTPYGFVRELRAKASKHPGSSQQDAVRMLTVHGAKGLEAKAVFVVDAQPEATRKDTASLLVDWDVHEPAPRVCAFVASGARCAPSLVSIDAQEQAFREREELNGLYVAMTRAAERLVFSCTQPYVIPKAGLSWWDRVYDVAPRWDVDAEFATAPQLQKPTQAPITTLHLPRLGERALEAARVSASLQMSRSRDHGRVANLGNAVHRMLEWSTPTSLRPDVEVDDAAFDALCLAACVESQLLPSDAAAVGEISRRLLEAPQLSPFLLDGGWVWSGNEVPIADGSKSLRIDRLVAMATEHGCEWWVLDYKLDHQPEKNPDYVAQINRYRAIIMQMQPGDVVRAALISGDGHLREVAEEEVAA